MGRKKFTREQGFNERDLLHSGIDHLQSAGHLIGIGFDGLDSAGYLAHLGLELLLKALWLHVADEFEDIHGLQKLIAKCAENGVTLEFSAQEREMLASLDRFNNLRYPNPIDGVSISTDNIGALPGLLRSLLYQFPDSMDDEIEAIGKPESDGTFRKSGRVCMVKYDTTDLE